jgi:hypothetical protein
LPVLVGPRTATSRGAGLKLTMAKGIGWRGRYGKCKAAN